MRRLRPTLPAILLILVGAPAILALLRLQTGGSRAAFLGGVLAIPVPLLLLGIRRVIWRQAAVPRTREQLARAHGELGLFLFWASYVILCIYLGGLLWLDEEPDLISELPLAARIAMALAVVFMWLVVLYAGRAVLRIEPPPESYGGDDGNGA